MTLRQQQEANVRRLMQVMGLLLIVAGVWHLLHGAWWLFVMFTAFGISQQIDSKKSKTAKSLRDVLLMTTLVVAIIRIAIMFLG
jgi:4-hydroxybenzoate polyprenyltransferase